MHYLDRSRVLNLQFSDREFMELWALEKVPSNSEEFMLENGAPVELAIIDEDDEILATHEEIGWITYDF